MKKFLKKLLKAFLAVFLYILISLAGPAYVYLKKEVDLSAPWFRADRSRTGIAPAPSEFKEPLVQIYAARAYHWRGLFAVHPWLAIKERNAEQYTVIEILSWNLRRTGNTISIRKDYPDRKWFGNDPDLILELRGTNAERAISKIRKLLPQYPYGEVYKAYPGPNSNTFMAYLIERVPELNAILPPTAIGQRYPIEHQILSWGFSPAGFRVSLWGHAGFALGTEEGIRFFLFGVEWGINPWKFQIAIPGIGILGKGH